MQTVEMVVAVIVVVVVVVDVVVEVVDYQTATNRHSRRDGTKRSSKKRGGRTDEVGVDVVVEVGVVEVDCFNNRQPFIR